MGSNSRGKFVFCLVIVFIFIGLGRAYRLEGGGGRILKLSNRGQAWRGWDHFYGGSWPLKTPCKDFSLAIVGGLGWDEMVKKWDWEIFIFHAIISALCPFWWKIFSMLYSQSWKNNIVTKLGNSKRWWCLVKTFDHISFVSLNWKLVFWLIRIWRI